MTDQGKPTTEDMLSLLLSMHEYQSSPLTPLGEMQYEAIIARLSEYDRLAQELDALKADVCSALGAYEHEGPRLAALRVMDEKQKAEAALAEVEQPVSREWLRFQAGEIWSAKTIDDATDTLSDTLKGFGVNVEEE